jgi:hypothetical protein
VRCSSALIVKRSSPQAAVRDCVYERFVVGAGFKRFLHRELHDPTLGSLLKSASPELGGKRAAILSNGERAAAHALGGRAPVRSSQSSNSIAGSQKLRPHGLDDEADVERE